MSTPKKESFLDSASDFVDDNLRVFRILPWAIGGIGAWLFIKHTHFFTQFRVASKVPHRLIQQNKVLSGHVTKCYWDGIGVWHGPIGMRILKWRVMPPAKPSEESLLCVKFSGVAISSTGKLQEWLDSNLKGQPVRFKLLHYNHNLNALECIVYTKKKGFLSRRYNVNQAIISQGLGSLTDVKGFKNNQEYVKFISQMSRNEIIAQKKGHGVWEGTEHVSWWRRMKH